MTKPHVKIVKFTESERQLIENFCKIGQKAKTFGTLEAKKYFGNNPSLQFLNRIKTHYALKNIGVTKLIKEGEDYFWYLWAIDGETYRVIEPENGIDEILELEFKRY
mgnify:CR=1 FL=1